MENNSFCAVKDLWTTARKFTTHGSAYFRFTAQKLKFSSED